jgi:hypothetical protein
MDKFESGWIGVSLAVSRQEIELLIQRLKELHSGTIGHFHLRNEDFLSEEGISDIEITTMGAGESDNMTVD